MIVPHSLDPVALVAGIGFGLSLIVAIGAQNAFVLRQGLLRSHVFAVVAVCAVSDVVLIGLGIAGVGVAIQQLPWLMVVARMGGAVFLVVYAALAARRALHPAGFADDLGAKSPGTAQTAEHLPAAARARSGTATGHGHATPVQGTHSDAGARPRRDSGGLLATVLTCVALTWLNPHVYLDTVVLLGSVANTHGDSRWLFGLGAGIGSVVWFTALGYGARFLRPLFARPAAWRVLDGVIAVTMAAIAVSLVLGL